MKKEVHKMITLTDIDVINLLRKNGLDADELQTNVVELLAKTGLKIATAESCTGGLISERITSVSGASAVFDCGICSYANSIKEKLLGVSGETLEVLGAVSAETAIQMAEGIGCRYRLEHHRDRGTDRRNGAKACGHGVRGHLYRKAHICDPPKAGRSKYCKFAQLHQESCLGRSAVHSDKRNPFFEAAK